MNNLFNNTLHVSTLNVNIGINDRFIDLFLLSVQQVVSAILATSTSSIIYIYIYMTMGHVHAFRIITGQHRFIGIPLSVNRGRTYEQLCGD